MSFADFPCLETKDHCCSCKLWNILQYSWTIKVLNLILLIWFVFLVSLLSLSLTVSYIDLLPGRMGGLPMQNTSALALPGSQQNQVSAVTSGPESKPKKKICCACPETKKLRDECIVEHGEEACAKWIEAHRKCLRAEGFNVWDWHTRFIEWKHFELQTIYFEDYTQIWFDHLGIKER